MRKRLIGFQFLQDDEAEQQDEEGHLHLLHLLQGEPQGEAEAEAQAPEALALA